MNMIKVVQVSGKRDKKKFFKFLIDLYRGNPYAAPNLYADEFAEFDPNVNDAFRFADCKMFLAYKDGKLAGRIAGIWHRGANQKTGLKQLRFTRFDVIDDFEVTKALFEKLFEWARELGMDEIIGPISFSDLNEEGMLIEGFDKDSTYIEIYNYPYYVEHMQKLGAYKVVDWNSYRMSVPAERDVRLSRLAEAIKKRGGYEVLDVEGLPRRARRKFFAPLRHQPAERKAEEEGDEHDIPGAHPSICRRHLKGRPRCILRLCNAVHAKSAAKGARQHTAFRYPSVHKSHVASRSRRHDVHRRKARPLQYGHRRDHNGPHPLRSNPKGR